jgi:hypothetical protein
LGPAIDGDAEWLADRQAAKATVLRQLHVVVEFNGFVQARGASCWEELPAHLEACIEHRLRKNGKWCRTAKDRAAVRSQARAPIEQLLRLFLPGYAGTARRRPWPLQATVPGLLEHLRDERRLRPDTLQGDAHHLRAFEQFLHAAGIADLSALTPAVLTRFLSESTAHMLPGGRQGRAGMLRGLLRFARRQVTFTPTLGHLLSATAGSFDP